MTVLSVNVGKPKNVPWHGRTVYTGVWKQPVDGPAMVSKLNIDGDGQGDLNGPAATAGVLMQIDSYLALGTWPSRPGRPELRQLRREPDHRRAARRPEVCIGDRYRIGEAEFEVWPRVTCYRVGMRLGQPNCPRCWSACYRPGFYIRVIAEGRVEAGDQIVKTRTGPRAPRGRHRRAALPAGWPAAARRHRYPGPEPGLATSPSATCSGRRPAG